MEEEAKQIEEVKPKKNRASRFLKIQKKRINARMQKARRRELYRQKKEKEAAKKKLIEKKVKRRKNPEEYAEKFKNQKENTEKEMKKLVTVLQSEFKKTPFQKEK